MVFGNDIQVLNNYRAQSIPLSISYFRCVFFNSGKNKKVGSRVNRENMAPYTPFLSSKNDLAVWVECCEFQTLVPTFRNVSEFSSVHNFCIHVW